MNVNSKLQNRRAGEVFRQAQPAGGMHSAEMRAGGVHLRFADEQAQILRLCRSQETAKLRAGWVCVQVAQFKDTTSEDG